MVLDLLSNYMMLLYFLCFFESFKGIKLIGVVFRKMFLFICFFFISLRYLGCCFNYFVFVISNSKKCCFGE